MAATKKLTLTCTGIALQEDGRMQVTMVKSAAAATGKTAGGATVVNPDDARLTLMIDASDAPTYVVGKDYAVSIAG